MVALKCCRWCVPVSIVVVFICSCSEAYIVRPLHIRQDTGKQWNSRSLSRQHVTSLHMKTDSNSNSSIKERKSKIGSNETKTKVPGVIAGKKVENPSGLLHFSMEKGHDISTYKKDGAATAWLKNAAGGQEVWDGPWPSRMLLIAAAALYGTNFGCVKLLDDVLDPSTAACVRFGIAALAFSPFLRKISPAMLMAGLEVGFWNALGYCAQSIALTSTSASKAAFICSLSVILIPILDSLFVKFGGGERKEVEVGKSPMHSLLERWAAPLLAVAGVACLELGGIDAPVVGDVWALAQPLFFGMAFWRLGKISSENPSATMELTAAQLLGVAVFTSGWALVEGGGKLIGWSTLMQTFSTTPMVVTALLWTGLVTTALTVAMETTALKKLSAAESTVILSTEPLWGSAFAAALLGEKVGLNTAAGALLVLTACLWSTVQPHLLRGPAAAGALLGLGDLVDGIPMEDSSIETLKDVINKMMDIDP